MHQFQPISYDAVATRWHQAVVANCLLKWHAIACWLKGEAFMSNIYGHTDLAKNLNKLSSQAYKRALALQPVHELEDA